MKLILSRKGFDSSAGGVASPILEDGSMLSLPIPAQDSPILYGDIDSRIGNVGKIVEALTKGRITSSSGAHLDPDLEYDALNRLDNWMPLFGQSDQAQGHLNNQGIDVGDIFLFYGWFNEVRGENLNISYKNVGAGKHVLWGWFQIGEINTIDSIDQRDKTWARYHPHFHQSINNLNTLYTAKKYLTIHDNDCSIPGAGVFPVFQKELQLTDPESNLKSVWKLPEWFYPSSPSNALTYHADTSRWSKCKGGVNLKTVGRGQEFVLDTEYYPEAINWILDNLSIGLKLG